MLEEFIKAYLHICSDGDLVAERHELVDYCKKKNLDQNLVQVNYKIYIYTHLHNS